jgi:hypothetical protein
VTAIAAQTPARRPARTDRPEAAATNAHPKSGRRSGSPRRTGR